MAWVLLVACGNPSAPNRLSSATPRVEAPAAGSSAQVPAPAAPAATAGAAAIGGRATWAPVAEPFAAERIRVVQSTGCAISKEGKVACWGQVEHADDSVRVERRGGMSTPHVLAGVTGAVDVVRIWHLVCVAQRQGAGDGGCFSTIDLGSRKVPAFPTPPVELQLHRLDEICAVMRDGSAGCVDLDGNFTAAPGIRDAKSLVCNQRACCAITKAGDVQCWGNEPPKLPKLSGVTSIAFHYDGGCARTQTGAAVCWGDAEAKALAQPRGVRDVAVLESGSQLCVVRDDGTLRCEDADEVPAATHVAQADYNCVRHTNGAVSCTGLNPNGELGDGGLMLSPVPLQVPGVDDIVDLAVASTNVCGVRRDQTLWCWGQPAKPTSRGALDGTLIPAKYNASCRSAGHSIRCSKVAFNGEWETESISPPKAPKIKTAALHRFGSACIVDDKGQVQCSQGSVDGNVDQRWEPLPSPGPVENLEPLAAGFCARHKDGRISCFVDRRYDGSEGVVSKLPNSKLTLVGGIKGATTLATGTENACVINTAREVWCWDAEKPKPWQMTTLTGATALGANHVHTCAIVRGETWCWGDNFLGQLGTGTGGRRNAREKEPVKVNASFKAIKVGTGRDSTCALDDKGKVWCWGGNENAELGQPRILRATTWSKVVGLGP